MKKGVRYEIQHVGDSFVSLVVKVSRSAMESAKGVVRTYDIHNLRRKKKKIARSLGERLVTIGTESPELDVSQDNVIKEIFSELHDIQEGMDIRSKKDKEGLAPNASAA